MKLDHANFNSRRRHTMKVGRCRRAAQIWREETAQGSASVFALFHARPETKSGQSSSPALPRLKEGPRGRAAVHPSRHQRGLTVLEMLVSTTLLLFIVVGLTAMFIQTQKAFKAGTKQTDVTDAGRTVLDLMAADLAQLSDAQNINVVNLTFGWSRTNTTLQYMNGYSTPYRTNQEQEIFFLIHTNAQWVGIGYAMSNTAPGVGTLYRYVLTAPAPLTNNVLYGPFSNAVSAQTFGPHFGRVADGVVHLKIRAYDQLGNESIDEYGNDYAPSASFSYPLYYTNNILVPTNDLPVTLQLEVAVLEPDTYAQARVMPGSLLTNFLVKAAANTHVFRQNIPIMGATR